MYLKRRTARCFVPIDEVSAVEFAFYFSASILILYWFFSSISFIICLFQLLISMAYSSIPNSIPISGIFLLFVSVSIFSIFGNSLRLSLYSRLLIFSCDLEMCCPFLCDWMASLLLQIKTTKAIFPEKCLSEF